MSTKDVRQGTGFFRARYGWIDSIEAAGLAVLGAAVWGVPSAESALLAVPMALRILPWFAFALTIVAVQFSYIGSERRISFCSVGHFTLARANGRIRFAWNEDGLFARGIILDEVQPARGSANYLKRLRIVVGAMVGSIALLLMICFRSLVLTDGPTWLCTGELAVVVLTASTIRTWQYLSTLSQAAVLESQEQKRAIRDLTSLMRSGIRPREYPLDLVNSAFQHLSETSFAPGRDMLIYFVLVDRGNWVAATESLDDCLVATEQGRLAPIQVINPLVTDVCGMAAVHLAWVDGDSVRAARALAMCERAWMSPQIQHLAESAISLRNGDWLSAEASGRRVMADAQAQLESGISVLLADWAEYIVEAAARRESGPGHSDVPRLAFDPPHVYGPVYSLTDWPSVI